MNVKIFGLILVLVTCFSCITCVLDIEGNFCRARRGVQCCPERNDDCSAPILGTLCYCDRFCNRTSNDDCCPDYWSHCLGISRPLPERRGVCYKDGRRYYTGQTTKINCNTCTCKAVAKDRFELICEQNECLVRPELISSINRGRIGWKAANYSFFWGKTLDDGIRYRLGTFKPTRLTIGMNEIHYPDKPDVPEYFDARQKWPNLIQRVRDQGDCASSWAFSTTALASDRLGIQSNGNERRELSPQNLLSCQNSRQKGCQGGHLDRAWWYIRKYGVVTEDCYPYDTTSTKLQSPCYVSRLADPFDKIKCPNKRGKTSMLYKSAPPYKISSQEGEIMNEIYKNGPVQATFKVKRDFFLYKSGVYMNRPREFSSNKHGYHSVRIIGWGVDRTDRIRPVKYWLCANSWGQRWGEDGYFRIIRGQDECEIESFVLGVWAKRNVRPLVRNNDIS